MHPKVKICTMRPLQPFAGPHLHREEIRATNSSQCWVRNSFQVVFFFRSAAGSAPCRINMSRTPSSGGRTRLGFELHITTGRVSRSNCEFNRKKAANEKPVRLQQNVKATRSERRKTYGHGAKGSPAHHRRMAAGEPRSPGNREGRPV